MNCIRIHIFALFLTALVATIGCTVSRPRPSIIVTEAKIVSACVYLDTLSEISDMGKVQLHPKHTYDAQERVIHRAVKLGATHIVWLHNTPQGSAARAYQCP